MITFVTQPRRLIPHDLYSQTAYWSQGYSSAPRNFSPPWHFYRRKSPEQEVPNASTERGRKKWESVIVYKHIHVYSAEGHFSISYGMCIWKGVATWCLQKFNFLSVPNGCQRSRKTTVSDYRQFPPTLCPKSVHNFTPKVYDQLWVNATGKEPKKVLKSPCDSAIFLFLALLSSVAVKGTTREPRVGVRK